MAEVAGEHGSIAADTGQMANARLAPARSQGNWEQIKNWAFASVLVVVAIILLIVVPVNFPLFRGGLFLILLALMWLEFNVLGLLINGRPAGAFIDNRNRLSLSKLQAAAWTAVVLSGFTTAAAYNIATAAFQDTAVTSLAITIPGELLLAMGISATSLVATPTLLTLKSQQPEPEANVEDLKAKLGSDFSNIGKLAVRDDSASASWSDIVTGEEVGNAASPDLGKIQQAAITLLLLGCYIAYIYAELAGPQEIIRTLPTLDQSFVWLLGISHASYLAYKAAPHTT